MRTSLHRLQVCASTQRAQSGSAWKQALPLPRCPITLPSMAVSTLTCSARLAMRRFASIFCMNASQPQDYTACVRGSWPFHTLPLPPSAERHDMLPVMTAQHARARGNSKGKVLLQMILMMLRHSLEIPLPTCCCRVFKGSRPSVVSAHNVPFCDRAVPLGQAACSTAQSCCHCRP